jgi:hypothetical protein
MSMSLLIAKIAPQLRDELVRAGPELAHALFFGKGSHPAFDSKKDVVDWYGYGDLAYWLEEEPDHPASLLLSGNGSLGSVLIEDYEWAYSYPTYLTPDEVVAAHRALQTADWPFDDMMDLFERAIAEGKGVVYGFC